MNKNHEMNGKKLTLIKDEKKYEISFDFPIRQVVSFDNYFIVRIEPDMSSTYNENVFGISSTGKILWQIEAIPHVYDRSSYTYVGKEGENLRMSNWDGASLLVEPLTGKIIQKSFRK